MIKTANDLRNKFGGISLHFKWMGVDKKAEIKDVHLVAELLGASQDSISLEKKLINTGDKDYRKLTAIRSKLRNQWKDNTLPWIESGVRLINKEEIEKFKVDIFEPQKQALEAAVEALEKRWPEILSKAPERLGKLYNQSDYPLSTKGLFDTTISFPNLEPPGYLPPQVFEQQNKLVQKQFEEALKISEIAFAEELRKLVEHLAERLTPDSDGKIKKFKEASVDGVYEFLEKMKKMNFGSSEELSKSVEKVKGVLGGLTGEDLRQLTSDGIKKVTEQLTESVESLPKRNIIKGKKKTDVTN